MSTLRKSLIGLSWAFLPLTAWASHSAQFSNPSNIAVLPSAGRTDQPVTVLSVGDGDTLTVNDGRQKTTIRVACIDAPEMKQAPYGDRARARLLQLAPIGSEVRVQAKETDRYGRTVAEVFRGKINLGISLVQEGHAVVYRQYLSNCDGNAYLRNEEQAKTRKLAFWSQPSPTMPWDFRRGTQSTQAPKPASSKQGKECDPAYPQVCIPPYSLVGDLDCADLAFKRIVTLPDDPHKLDGNRDGIGCE